VHPNAFDFVWRTTRTHPLPKGLVVEIGGRNINGSIRSLFGASYLSIDIADGPGVDVVANGATFRPVTRPAVVVCCEVLEHAKDAEAICANAHRILIPGGVFIVTAATEGRLPHSAVDGGNLRDGEFYRNVTAANLWAWCKRFKTCVIEFNRETCDIYAIAEKAKR